MFWKAIPEANWPDDREYCGYIMEKWQKPFGDMRQELVFIGQNMDKTRMIEALDNCLLSEEQVLDGMEAWRQLPNPFPAWE